MRDTDNWPHQLGNKYAKEIILLFQRNEKEIQVVCFILQFRQNYFLIGFASIVTKKMTTYKQY